MASLVRVFKVQALEPVYRFSLLTAKYLAVVTVAVLTAVVNLIGMVITLQVSGLARQLLPGAGLTPLLIVQLFGLLLLFAAFWVCAASRDAPGEKT